MANSGSFNGGTWSSSNQRFIAENSQHMSRLQQLENKKNGGDTIG